MRTLYELKGTLMVCCIQSHINHNFFIDKDLHSIYIQLKYDRSSISDDEAKRLIQARITEDSGSYSKDTINNLMDSWERFRNIRNLITLSFDDSNGFRGASHRGVEDLRITILPDFATEGYIKGVIPKGTLNVTLSTHALVKDCFYHLKIETD